MSRSDPSVRECVARWSYGEERLAVGWRCVQAGTSLKSVEGDEFIVVESGRRNRHDGPDFQDAVVLCGGELLKGDVECHLSSGDWFRHGHDRDHRYDDVILHVVSGYNRGAVTSLGREIPTVVMTLREVTDRHHLGENVKPLKDAEALERLMPFIHHRWWRKVALFRRRLRGGEAVEQAFLSATFRALGYPGNREPFERLAALVPLDHVQGMAPGEIEYYLLRLSGLAKEASSYGRTAEAQLLSRWPKGGVLSPEVWRHGGVRPYARPGRRMRFAAEVVYALAGEWRPWSRSDETKYVDLRHLFPDALPGRAWTTEWIGNVIYPFRHAWEGANCDLERWFELTLPAPYGRFRRGYGGIISRKLLRNFAVCQGLIELRSRWPRCLPSHRCPLCC